MMKSIYLLKHIGLLGIILIGFYIKGFSAISIIDKPTLHLCEGSDYVVMDDIVIVENEPGDFQLTVDNNNNLRSEEFNLRIPNGFEISNTPLPTVALNNNSEIEVILNIEDNLLKLSIKVSGTSMLDEIRIQGLRLRPRNFTVELSEIIRPAGLGTTAGGNANVVGSRADDLSYGSLSVRSYEPNIEVKLNGGTNFSICRDVDIELKYGAHSR